MHLQGFKFRSLWFDILCFYWCRFRTIVAVQHCPVPQSRVHQRKLGNPEGNLRDQLGVHHDVRDGRRKLCCRIRSVLCRHQLHLWRSDLHQHPLHQELRLPQQHHTNLHRNLFIHRQKGLRWCLSAKGRIENEIKPNLEHARIFFLELFCQSWKLTVR